MDSKVVKLTPEQEAQSERLKPLIDKLGQSLVDNLNANVLAEEQERLKAEAAGSKDET